jgi:hypothetical protein
MTNQEKQTAITQIDNLVLSEFNEEHVRTLIVDALRDQPGPLYRNPAAILDAVQKLIVIERARELAFETKIALQDELAS